MQQKLTGKAGVPQSIPSLEQIFASSSLPGCGYLFRDRSCPAITCGFSICPDRTDLCPSAQLRGRKLWYSLKGSQPKSTGMWKFWVLDVEGWVLAESLSLVSACVKALGSKVQKDFRTAGLGLQAIPAQPMHLPEEFYNSFLLLTWLLPCSTNSSDINHKSTSHPSPWLLLHISPITDILIMKIPHSYSCCFLMSVIHEDLLFCLLLPLLCMGVETLSLINASLTMLFICCFQTTSSSALDLSLQLSSWEYQAPPWGAGRMWGDLESCPWSAPLSSQGPWHRNTHKDKKLCWKKAEASSPLRKAGGRGPKYLYTWWLVEKQAVLETENLGFVVASGFIFLRSLADNFLLFSKGLNWVWN